MTQTRDTDGGGPDNGDSKHADEDEVGKAHEERDEKRRNQQQVRLIELRRQLCTHPSGASWTRFRRAHVRVKPACKHQCARADSGIKPTKTRHRPNLRAPTTIETCCCAGSSKRTTTRMKRARTWAHLADGAAWVAQRAHAVGELGHLSRKPGLDQHRCVLRRHWRQRWNALEKHLRAAMLVTTRP